MKTISNQLGLVKIFYSKKIPLLCPEIFREWAKSRKVVEGIYGVPVHTVESMVEVVVGTYEELLLGYKIDLEQEVHKIQNF